MLFSLSCVLTLIVHVSSRSISNHQERLSSRIHCMRTERLSAARYLRVSSCTFREDRRTPLREEALSFYQGLDRCDVPGVPGICNSVFGEGDDSERTCHGTGDYILRVFTSSYEYLTRIFDRKFLSKFLQTHLKFPYKTVKKFKKLISFKIF